MYHTPYYLILMLSAYICNNLSIGPYYLFNVLQRLRNSFGNWAVLPCIQGGRLPLVPVDYVVSAMDALAHMNGLNGRCFHLVDCSPKLFVDALNVFATAAHAPTFSARLPTLVLSFLPTSFVSKLRDQVPIISNAPREVAAWMLDIPRTVMNYVDWRCEFDDSDTQALIRSLGIKCPPLESYGWRLWVTKHVT